jgi:YD repeat-containing protein
MCQTVAGSSTPTCDAAAPRLQTTYQYGADGTADNLLVRGTEVKDLVTGTKRLTCFTYDTLGRKISETSPRGNAIITVCP